MLVDANLICPKHRFDKNDLLDMELFPHFPFPKVIKPFENEHRRLKKICSSHAEPLVGNVLVMSQQHTQTIPN